MPPLTASLRLSRPGFQLEVELVAHPKRTLVLVGESGAGKTTVLDLLSGIKQPDTGRITFGEETWLDTERPEAFVPPHHRPTGYVAQHPTLFPHLNVLENVAFGLRASSTPRKAAIERAHSALAEVELADLAGRKPDELSGGQRQRITLARALCLEPALLLLDEPLSSLDVTTRQSMRAQVRRVLEKLQCVTLYVTHDPLEALAFGDDIAVMEHGKLTQFGTKTDLLRQPRSQYIGRFVGINLFRGTAIPGKASDGTTVKVRGVAFSVADVECNGDVYVAIPPNEITLSRNAPEGSARNVFRGQVEEIVPTLPLGDRVRVQLKTNPPLVAEITRQAADAMDLQAGQEVFAAVKATGIETY